MSVRFFYPEGERIIRRSLNQWQRELEGQFSLLLSNPHQKDWNEALLILINQSSLIATYLGKNELAYQLCYGAITYFMSNPKCNQYVDGILQPWINIGRLCIIEKKFDEAHQNFDHIHPKQEVYYINKYSINKSLLNKNNFLVLKNCFFYEKLKIFLSDIHNIDELFIFCDEHQKVFKEYDELFLEAKIVALILKNEYLKAFEVLMHSLPSIRELYRPLFILRVIDLSILLNEPSKKIKPLILNLFNQHIDYIQSLNLNGLYFCLEVCKRLKSIEENRYFLTLLNALIQRFHEINEEVALLESLALGKEFSEEYQQKFEALIYETNYVNLKKKYLYETKQYTYPLGEKLVSFLNKEI